MSDYLKPTIEKNTNWRCLAGLAALGYGMSLFCNAADILKYLKGPNRNTFEQLVYRSNERNEVEIFLEYIPDSAAREVADMINKSVKLNKPKPHHRMFDVLNSVYNYHSRKK
ncbi:hypothetical protein A2774_00360 [Candidatus Roizmanbacteria bacterium RIFCSPHIGHO2_01_FULL_39_12c]|uniref:Uncharacterized protein n=1 Tax=Candidatus Roizmanbacteria bacterium RIFCSPHIGHO2_01_FULL_39_12c TaxID=1802031 RepID=A0A1F7GDL9_9BACT|nr:MAG: hypothetical protein A2774_00360 [Candidatus Roizmanbacteria bacterium RIFCSPHIGHO2_01_FULL_39_12c]